MSDDAYEPAEFEQLQEMVNEATIVRAVNLIISQALNDKAWSIHLEQEENQGRVRYRVDGQLFTVMEPPKQAFPAILTRLKIMANMDIADARHPQDGLIHLNHDGIDYDLLASCSPGLHGEKMVLRISLARVRRLEDCQLSELDLSPASWQHLSGLLQRRAGLCLVAGVCGSGRTTLLYSCLRHLNQDNRCLHSIEDDLAVRLPWVHQVKVDRRQGLSTAQLLRVFMRQDPDVIMVGALSDRETASLALEAAVSGHLVLAESSGFDAASSLQRLIDFPVEPFMVASAVIGAVGLRLARRLCAHCREPFAPSPAALGSLGSPRGPFFRAAGCAHCQQRGFSGRCGLHEVLVPGEAQREVLLSRGSLQQIRQAAPADFVSLRQDGLQKVAQGLISPEEFLRIFGDDGNE
ncbi:MAG: GspE/PulE family protein [Vulcanimicrobiota bacterium]